MPGLSSLWAYWWPGRPAEDQETERLTIPEEDMTSDLPAVQHDEPAKTVPVSELEDQQTEQPTILEKDMTCDLAAAQHNKPAETVTTSKPDISEYFQPSWSHYQSRPVEGFTLSGRRCYTVPESLINQHPGLRRLKTSSKTVNLKCVDDDVAHTFIHYLYTGDYQTLKPSPDCKIPRPELEYNRSFLKYCAALYYGLDGLEAHAKKYMQMFGRDVPIIKIVSIARERTPQHGMETVAFFIRR